MRGSGSGMNRPGPRQYVEAIVYGNRRLWMMQHSQPEMVVLHRRDVPSAWKWQAGYSRLGYWQANVPRIICSGSRLATS
jgi:hypothetical protein